jgi:phosphoglycolate phosphatase-like HAD superfamily hydrolase
MSAILFDLDRTLIDVQTHTDYPAALRDVEAVVGAWDDPPTPPTGWDGPTRRAMGILVALSGDDRWSQVSDLIKRHELAGVEASEAMPGLAEILEASARLPRAVVTLLPPGAARAALDRHGVEIEVVIGRRPDLRPKPAPDQLLEACRRLGVHHADAIMIGDSTWDHAAAVAAGCGFTGLTNHGPNEFPDGVEVFPDLAALADRVE